MVTYGQSSVNYGIYGKLWQTMVKYGKLWQTMTNYGNYYY